MVDNLMEENEMMKIIKLVCGQESLQTNWMKTKINILMKIKKELKIYEKYHLDKLNKNILE